MKSFLSVCLVASLISVANAGAAFAEDGKVMKVVKGTGFAVKKAIVLPIYVIGGGAIGAGLGVLAWIYVGGHRGDLKNALSGHPTGNHP